MATTMMSKFSWIWQLMLTAVILISAPGIVLASNDGDVRGHYHAIINVPPNNNYSATLLGTYSAMRTGTLTSRCCSDPTSFATKEMWFSPNFGSPQWTETGDTTGSFANLTNCSHQQCYYGYGYFNGAFCGGQYFSPLNGSTYYQETAVQLNPVAKDHTFEIFATGQFVSAADEFLYNVYYDGYFVCQLYQSVQTSGIMQAGLESYNGQLPGLANYFNDRSRNTNPPRTDIYNLQYYKGGRYWYYWPQDRNYYNEVQPYDNTPDVYLGGGRYAQQYTSTYLPLDNGRYPTIIFNYY